MACPEGEPMSRVNRKNSAGGWPRRTRLLSVSVAAQPVKTKRQAENDADIQTVDDGPWVVFSLDQAQGDTSC